MPSELDARRLVEESLPAAVALLLWSLLATVAQNGVALGLRIAGIVMALLYVAVRASALADSLAVDEQPTDPEPILRENVSVALAAGVWFLSALVVALFADFIENIIFPLRGLFSAISFVLAATGVATVIFYAVAVGTARLRGQVDSGEQPAAE